MNSSPSNGGGSGSGGVGVVGSGDNDKNKDDHNTILRYTFKFNYPDGSHFFYGLFT